MSAPQDRLRHCVECPRNCGVDRLSGELGYCRTDGGWNVASVCRHRGEEPVVSGAAGICNVFFQHCNLQCRFCQNYQISDHERTTAGGVLSPEQVLDEVETLLRKGLTRVGLVSPSHVLPQAEQFMAAVHGRGMNPVWVFNTNAYDRPDRLAGLAGRVQVYLPDYKYADPDLAAACSDAPDYPAVAQAVLREMYRQTGPALELDAAGGIRSGLIVRHLVLPGQVENSKACLRFIAGELSPEVTISLMAQYTPVPRVNRDPVLGRALRPEEYAAVVEEMHRLGLENGWIQELDSAGHYQPDFDQPSPFSS